MIPALVRAGKKVGVTANSHKVIGNLLEKVAELAADIGQPIRIGQKPAEGETPTCPAAIAYSNAGLLGALGAGEVDGLKEIVIVAAYNTQVGEVIKLLPGARVGTVDKFQGQEAPISIYSMATSSQAEAPRGMEFLYSLNRLNVATSRARCLAVVVASPAMMRVRARNPRQVRLANALYEFAEASTDQILPSSDDPIGRERQLTKPDREGPSPYRLRDSHPPSVRVEAVDA